MGPSPLRSCICIGQRGPTGGRSEPTMGPSPLRSCICIVLRGPIGTQNGSKACPVGPYIGPSPFRSRICIVQRGPTGRRPEPRTGPSPLLSRICIVRRGPRRGQDRPKSTLLAYMHRFRPPPTEHGTSINNCEGFNPLEDRELLWFSSPRAWSIDKREGFRPPEHGTSINVRVSGLGNYKKIQTL